MANKSLFVSHISEEGEYAALLKEMIQDDFLDFAKCFTSSDIGSIGAGENWLSAVEDAMADAKAVMVLCSKASVHRPWVQFEVGAAWMKGVPVIPVCHSGMRMSDLQMPLCLRQGVELPTERGVAQLYEGIARVLRMPRPPRPSELDARLRAMKDVETRLRMGEVQQFELYIDVVVPAPGRIAGEAIPDDAAVESSGASLQLFGLLDGTRLTWADIVRQAKKRPDTRWLRELQRSIALASNNERFRPVQAVFHGESGSYQPQLAKMESRSDGSSRFHVHFVHTVVAPLSDVQNEFGTLATLLRLGLRFRYEVIERFQRCARKGALTRPGCAEVVRSLRDAIETIETDARSRGAEHLDRETVLALFDSEDDVATMTEVQDGWDDARQALFADDPPPSPDDVARVLARMRRLNYDFMRIGTRRYHELVDARWAEPALREVRSA